MDVTIFIGNGFDLNVGLKTSFTHFLDYYNSIRSRNPVIAEWKHRIQSEIRQNVHSWSDLEISLGRLTTQFSSTARGEQEFCALLEDIEKRLSEFMHDAQNDAIFDSASKQNIHHYFEGALRCPYKGLPADGLEIVAEAWRKQLYQEDSIQFHFISYNYTRVFDTCLMQFIKQGSKQTYTVRQKPITFMYSSVTHIHGLYSKNMIFGVDNLQQIHNTHFQKSDVVTNRFIKPKAIEQIHTGMGIRARKALDKSKFVFVIGMSLGSSDESWWRYLGNWLKDTSHHLAIYYNDPTYSSVDIIGTVLIEAKIHELFRRILDKDTYEMAKYRIYIAFNQSLFSFKLLH